MNYREEVLRTAASGLAEPFSTQLSLAGLGIAGEAGEVADIIKKVLHHGKPLDREKLVLEMGDVYWYLEYLCAALGTTREAVFDANVTKLRKRYPDGFSQQAANNRGEK